MSNTASLGIFNGSPLRRVRRDEGRNQLSTSQTLMRCCWPVESTSCAPTIATWALAV